MRRYGIRDDQWDRIKDLLPGRVGVTAKDNRLFVEAGALSLSDGHSLAGPAQAVRRLEAGAHAA